MKPKFRVPAGTALPNPAPCLCQTLRQPIRQTNTGHQHNNSDQLSCIIVLRPYVIASNLLESLLLTFVLCHETATPARSRVSAVHICAKSQGACVTCHRHLAKRHVHSSWQCISQLSVPRHTKPISPCPLLTASSESSLVSEVDILCSFCTSAVSNSHPVDYFRNAVDDPPLACFLSHVHSDHLSGLDTFKGRLVYCSAATRAMLLKLQRKASRINFAQGILEAEEITYKHQKNRLVSLSPVNINPVRR